MTKPSETAVVTANGSLYDTWETVEVERRFGQSITHTRLRVAEIGDNLKGWKTLRLKPGDLATVSLAGRQVANGFVAVRQFAYSASTHQVEFIISSKTAALVVSTPDDAMPGQFKNATLSSIVNRVTAPYGIAFKLQGNTAGAEKPFERVSIHVGETCFQFIERLCRFRNIHLVDDVNGDLIGTRASVVGSMAELVEGRNIESGHGVMQNFDLVNPIIVSGQNFGNDDHWGDDARDVTGIASNPAFADHRPMTMGAEQPGDKQDMVMRAQFEVAYNLASAFECFFTVPGWLRTNGSLWSDLLGQGITVYSPMAFPVDSLALALRGVTFRQSTETGTQTVLELCLPNALSADAPITAGDDAFPSQGGSVVPGAPDG